MLQFSVMRGRGRRAAALLLGREHRLRTGGLLLLRLAALAAVAANCWQPTEAFVLENVYLTSSYGQLVSSSTLRYELLIITEMIVLRDFHYSISA